MTDDLARRLAPALTPWFLTRDGSRDLGRGSAFPSTDVPGGVTVGDRFFRTDLFLPCVYTSAGWLTTFDFPLAFGAGGNTYATNYSATTASVRWASTRNDHQLYLTYATMTISTGATNNGSNYITYNFVDSTGATVWSVSTAADGTNATLTKAAASFTQPNAATSFIRLDIAVTGAPSAQFLYTPVLYARMIIT